MEGFLLVFDLDGTLVDSVPDLRAALNEMLRERGRRPLSSPEVKRMVGDGVPILVVRALAATGADPAEAATALPASSRSTRRMPPVTVLSGCAGTVTVLPARYRDLHQQATAGDLAVCRVS